MHRPRAPRHRALYSTTREPARNEDNDGGTFQRVDLDGFAGDGAFGQPVLPAQMIWIAVPEGARVSVLASGEGERLYDGLRLFPAGEGGGDALQGVAPAGDGLSAATPLLGGASAGTLPAAPYTDRAAYRAVGYGAAGLATL